MSRIRPSLLVLAPVLLAAVAAAETPGPAPPPAPSGPASPAADTSRVQIHAIPRASRDGLDPVLVSELDRAEAEIVRLMKDAPVDPAALAEAMGNLGLLAHAHRLDETAAACYDNAALLAPQDARWPHVLGLLLQQRGDLSGAAAQFERAAALTSYLAPRLRLAEVYRQLNRLDEASTLAQAVLDVSDAAAAHAILGEIALSRGAAQAAVEHLEAALTEVPEANRLHYPLAQAYRALGNEEEARRQLGLQGPVGLEPPDPMTAELADRTTGVRARRLRGRRAFGAGRYVEAIEAFRAAIADDPSSVEARVDLAAALAAGGDPHQALAELEAARRIGPETPTLAFNLGSLLLSLGEVEPAVAALRRAAAGQPGDAEIQKTLARALRASGKPAEALEGAHRAVEAAPLDEDAVLLEAQLLREAGREADALARLREASANLGDSLPLSHALALVLAISPDPAARDPLGALEVSLLAYGKKPSPVLAADAALAYAALERCEDAGRWQATALAGGAEPADPRARQALDLAAATPCGTQGSP